MPYSSHNEREAEAIRQGVAEADAYRPTLNDILARSRDPYGMLPKGVQRDMLALLALVGEGNSEIARLRKGLGEIADIGYKPIVDSEETFTRIFAIANASLAAAPEGANCGE